MTEKPTIEVKMKKPSFSLLSTASDSPLSTTTRVTVKAEATFSKADEGNAEKQEELDASPPVSEDLHPKRNEPEKPPLHRTVTSNDNENKTAADDDDDNRMRSLMRYRKRYKGKESFVSFFETHLEFTFADYVVLCKDVLQVYRGYCTKNGFAEASVYNYSRHLNSVGWLQTRLGTRGKQKYGYAGLKWTSPQYQTIRRKRTAFSLGCFFQKTIFQATRNDTKTESFELFHDEHLELSETSDLMYKSDIKKRYLCYCRQSNLIPTSMNSINVFMKKQGYPHTKVNGRMVFLGLCWRNVKSLAIRDNDLNRLPKNGKRSSKHNPMGKNCFKLFIEEYFYSSDSCAVYARDLSKEYGIFCQQERFGFISKFQIRNDLKTMLSVDMNNLPNEKKICPGLAWKGGKFKTLLKLTEHAERRKVIWRQIRLSGTRGMLQTECRNEKK